MSVPILKPSENRARPDSAEYPQKYAGYMACVPDGDIIAVLRQGGEELASSLRAIPESKGEYCYAEGRWTVRTLLGHMIDTERVLTYRALRIARGDVTPLSGFKENDYARAAGSDARTVADIVAEMLAVRESSVRLFASLPDGAWKRSGTVNDRRLSVRALAYITAGHTKHHLNVLRDRYGLCAF